MRSLQNRFSALFLLAVFVLGFLHCSLEAGDADEGHSIPCCSCSCLCNNPALEPVVVTAGAPEVRPIAYIMEETEPNGRLVAASIFNPPRA